MSAQDAAGFGNGLKDIDSTSVTVLNPTSERGVLLIADHAGNEVPSSLKRLGLSEIQLEQHIAWDPGAGEVATKLSNLWSATAVLSLYSRLIIDPNRPLGDRSSIPEVSDGTLIPANRGLSAKELENRANRFYWPYHRGIEQETARLRRCGPGPIIISIHSFTPNFGSEDRPWHIGIMSTKDRRLGDALIRNLSVEPELVIGDNEPYSGIEYGYTLKRHGGAQGLACVQIEIRQDLLSNDVEIDQWVSRLNRAFAPLLEDRDMLEIKHH